MGRSPGSRDNGLKKGPWTPEEDEKLVNYIQEHGLGSWQALPQHAGLNRCGKSCRLRWTNYLRPDIKRGKFSQEEEKTILNLHSFLGNKWSAIASHLPGRTDNEIKNFWNTHLKKKLIQNGFDPMTHQPRTDHLYSSLPQLILLANLRQILIDCNNPSSAQAAVQLQLSDKIQTLQYLLHSSSSSSSMMNPSNNLMHETPMYSGFGENNQMPSPVFSSLVGPNSFLNPAIKEEYNPSILNSLLGLNNETLFSQQLGSRFSQPLHYPSPTQPACVDHLQDPQQVCLNNIFQMNTTTATTEIMGQGPQILNPTGGNILPNISTSSPWNSSSIILPHNNNNNNINNASLPLPPLTEISTESNEDPGEGSGISNNFSYGGGGAEDSDYWPDLQFD